MSDHPRSPANHPSAAGSPAGRLGRHVVVLGAASPRLKPRSAPGHPLSAGKPLSARQVAVRPQTAPAARWSWTELTDFDRALEQQLALLRTPKAPETAERFLAGARQLRTLAASFLIGGLSEIEFLDVRLRRILSRLSPDDIKWLLKALATLSHGADEFSLWETSLQRGLLIRIQTEIATGLEPLLEQLVSPGAEGDQSRFENHWDVALATATSFVALLHEAGFVADDLELRRLTAYGLLRQSLARFACEARAGLFARLSRDELHSLQHATLPSGFHAALAIRPGEITRSEREFRHIATELDQEFQARERRQRQRIESLLAHTAAWTRPEALAGDVVREAGELLGLLDEVESSPTGSLRQRAAQALTLVAQTWSRDEGLRQVFFAELEPRQIRTLQDTLHRLHVSDLDPEVAELLAQRFHETEVALAADVAQLFSTLPRRDTAGLLLAARHLAGSLADHAELSTGVGAAAEETIRARGRSSRDVLRRIITGLDRPTGELQSLARLLESAEAAFAREVLQYCAKRLFTVDPYRHEVLYQSWLVFSELADALDDLVVTQSTEVVPLLERPERARKTLIIPADLHAVLRDVYQVPVASDGELEFNPA